MEKRLRQFQLNELEMLKEIAECLSRAEVQFYLIGGSCLGALRHKGFIPWDDDVDIAILRKDFDRAEKALAKLGAEMLYDPIENHRVPDAPLGHVYWLEDGVLEEAPRIDVFAIDNVPDSSFLERYQDIWAKVYHLCVLRRPSENRGRLNGILTKIICKFPKFLLDFLQRRAYKVITRWKDCSTEYVSNLFGVSGKKEKVPAVFYGKARYVPFEDIMMPIPEMAEEYSTHIYGDYMAFPPEEERSPSHFTKLID